MFQISQIKSIKTQNQKLCVRYIILPSLQTPHEWFQIIIFRLNRIDYIWRAPDYTFAEQLRVATSWTLHSRKTSYKADISKRGRWQVQLSKAGGGRCLPTTISETRNIWADGLRFWRAVSGSRRTTLDACVSGFRGRKSTKISAFPALRSAYKNSEALGTVLLFFNS